MTTTDDTDGAATAASLSTDDSFAIELRGISKRFGAVKANQDIDLRVRPGTIHGIVGQINLDEYSLRLLSSR